MYLTDKAKGKARDISDHTQAELLLEYCASRELSRCAIARRLTSNT